MLQLVILNFPVKNWNPNLNSGIFSFVFELCPENTKNESKIIHYFIL